MEHMGQNASSWQVAAALVIFFVSYAFIVSEKINRALIALCGALLMIVLGVMDIHTAYSVHIHWSTIFLLLGMMMLVGIANKSGIFQFIAIKTAQSTGGNPMKLMVRLAILTGVASAFIDNVTTVLIITPIIISIARALRISPIPFLITSILICNIGGAATLVGDPPNIMIGEEAGLSFTDFLLHMTPIIVVAMIVTILYLKRCFAKQLKMDPQYTERIMEIDAKEYLKDWALAKKSIFVFALTLVGFLTHQYIHIDPAVVALSGATLLMVIGTDRHDLEEVFHSIEWTTIFFFAGLFVLVGGLVETGIINKIAAWMIDVTGGDITIASFTLLWGAGVGSAFIDNIPLVATLIPMVQDMGAQMALSAVDLNTLWWSLALGACLGGNGTIVASSANMIVAGIANREGTKITFSNYLKVSVPITLITLVISNIYIYFVFIKLGFA